MMARRAAFDARCRDDYAYYVAADDAIVFFAVSEPPQYAFERAIYDATRRAASPPLIDAATRPLMRRAARYHFCERATPTLD